MDPTEVELNSMSNLLDVANWSGTNGAVHDALMVGLGTPSKLRDIILGSRCQRFAAGNGCSNRQRPSSPSSLEPN